MTPQRLICQGRIARSGSASGNFYLSRPTNGWPAGNYRLDVYVDGQLLVRFAFDAFDGLLDDARTTDGQFVTFAAHVFE